MELRNLYSFLRVAELGSYTKAAEELGYAQSTITAQIQQLEGELAVPLFERIGKKNMLTVYGQQLTAYANQIFQIEKQMKTLGQEDRSAIRGTLRIGVVESIMHSLLLAVIGRYRQLYPQVSVRIRLAVTAPLVEMLHHNEVDMIFTLGEAAAQDCVRAASHRENAVFIASPEHPLAQRASVPLATVFDYPLILTGENTYLQQQLHRMAFQCKKEVSSFLQTESSQLIIELVQQNLGISLLPEGMVRHASRPEKLCILPVKNFSLSFYTHIFYHKNKWVTPQMSSMLNLVEDYWRQIDKEALPR